MWYWWVIGVLSIFLIASFSTTLYLLTSYRLALKGRAIFKMKYEEQLGFRKRDFKVKRNPRKHGEFN